MTIDQLAEKLCKDLVRGVHQRGDRRFISTVFSYPNGDSIVVYVKGEGESLRLTDLGSTHFSLSVGGVDFTEPRRKFISSVCALYDVETDGEHHLSKPLREESIGADFIMFCEALVRISTLQYDVFPRTRSYFAQEVESLVAAKIETRRPVTKRWSDPKSDPRRAHVVDYHMNTIGEPRNILVVPSAGRVDTAADIIRFWHEWYPAKSMAIVDAELNIPEVAMERLRSAADSVVMGLSGNEESVVKFALGGMKEIAGTG